MSDYILRQSMREHPEWFESSSQIQAQAKEQSRLIESRLKALEARSGLLSEEGWTALFDVLSENFADIFTDALAPLHAENAALRAAIDELKAKAVPVYRGVWVPETSYDRGSLVTHDGSVWHANRATAMRPGSGEDACGWVLAVKRGSDGKSAFECAKAEGYRGSQAEWIRSLRAPTAAATPRP